MQVILTQEQLLLNAQAEFDALKKKIWEDSQAGVRIDQTERNACAEGVGGLGAILGVTMSVETAEAMNQRLTEYAEPFRL